MLYAVELKSSAGTEIMWTAVSAVCCGAEVIQTAGVAVCREATIVI